MKTLICILIITSSFALPARAEDKTEDKPKDSSPNVFQKIGHDIKAVGKDIGKEATKVGHTVSTDTKAARDDASSTGTNVGHASKNFFQTTGTAFKDFWHKVTGKTKEEQKEEPKKE